MTIAILVLLSAFSGGISDARHHPKPSPTPTIPPPSPTPTSSPTPSPTTPPAGTIEFSGYTWYVESSEQLVNPGPNYWSNSPQNVWLDNNGWLHLQITNRDGKWYCPELSTLQTLGYGTYVFYVASRIDNLDKNVVLGLFAYKDDYHEIDIEFAKWGNANNPNAWYTVQPQPTDSFNIQLYGDYSTHYFIWQPDSVFFESFGGHYTIGTQPQNNIIRVFTASSSVSAQGVRAHINLWLYHGYAPSNGLSAEVIIRSFQYIP